MLWLFLVWFRGFVFTGGRFIFFKKFPIMPKFKYCLSRGYSKKTIRYPPSGTDNDPRGITTNSSLSLYSGSYFPIFTIAVFPVNKMYLFFLLQMRTNALNKIQMQFSSQQIHVYALFCLLWHAVRFPCLGVSLWTIN